MSSLRTFLVSAAFIAVSGSALAEAKYVDGIVEAVDLSKNVVTYTNVQTGKTQFAMFDDSIKVAGKISKVEELKAGHTVRLKVAAPRVEQASL